VRVFRQVSDFPYIRFEHVTNSPRLLLLDDDDNDDDYRISNLPVAIKLIKLGKREHKTEAFLRLNKHGQVPVLVEEEDGTEETLFVLSESSAILKYLSEKHSTTSVVANRLYAAYDLKDKAKIWSAMDWYQTTIRSSAAGVCWNAFVAANMGGEVSLALAKHYESRLKTALEVLETKWLGDKTPFLNEREHPSIADLLVVEDIVNLVLLKGSPFREELSSLSRLLRDLPRARRWIDAVRGINAPVWDELHRVIETVAENAARKLDGVRGSGESNGSRVGSDSTFSSRL
jgi:glutathione S-transferase